MNYDFSSKVSQSASGRRMQNGSDNLIG